MKIEQFIGTIEGYFSPYDNQNVKAAVTRYLARFEEDNLPTLLDLVMGNHYVRLGTPCMASIEKIHKAYHEETGKTLKRNTAVSATAPVYDSPVISEEERAEVEAMMKEEGGILGIITRKHHEAS